MFLCVLKVEVVTVHCTVLLFHLSLNNQGFKCSLSRSCCHMAVRVGTDFSCLETPCRALRCLGVPHALVFACGPNKKLAKLNEAPTITASRGKTGFYVTKLQRRLTVKESLRLQGIRLKKTLC